MRNIFIHCPVCSDAVSTRGPLKNDVLHIEKGSVLDTVISPVFYRYIGIRRCKTGCKNWFVIIYAYSTFSYFSTAYHPEAENKTLNETEIFLFVLKFLEEKKIKFPKKLRRFYKHK